MEIKLEAGDEKSLALSRFLGIGKIISKKILNRIRVRVVLRGMWPIEMAPCISAVGENMYGISFKIEEFLRIALKERLWLVMGCCLILNH